MDAVRAITVRWLGRQPYAPVWRAMQRYTDERDGDTPDELWLVEHDPVFTLGQAGKAEHVLAAGDIPVIAVDRGGQVTYHGPGQLVAYPLVDVRRLGIGVKALVERIEQAIIDTSAGFGVPTFRRPGAPGVYTAAGAKIAALGLRLRRGSSFHGLAFNVDMDLEPYQRINPCGYAGQPVTSLLDCGGPADLRLVADALVPHLSLQLGLVPDWQPDLPALG